MIRNLYNSLIFLPAKILPLNYMVIWAMCALMRKIWISISLTKWCTNNTLSLDYSYRFLDKTQSFIYSDVSNQHLWSICLRKLLSQFFGLRALKIMLFWITPIYSQVKPNRNIYIAILPVLETQQVPVVVYRMEHLALVDISWPKQLAFHLWHQ